MYSECDTILRILAFIVGLVIFGMRIEHRLTKIEGDVNQIKDKMRIGKGRSK